MEDAVSHFVVVFEHVYSQHRIVFSMKRNRVFWLSAWRIKSHVTREEKKSLDRKLERYKEISINGNSHTSQNSYRKCVAMICFTTQVSAQNDAPHHLNQKEKDVWNISIYSDCQPFHRITKFSFTILFHPVDKTSDWNSVNTFSEPLK